MPDQREAPRRRAADDRRDELLQAAHALARTAGLDAVTPADVGAAAGASKALVFHYFGSTVELRRAVAAIAVDALDDALTVPDDTSGGGDRARRAAVVHTLLDAVLAERQVWTDIWSGALRDDDGTAARLDEVRARLFARFTRTATSASASPDDDTAQSRLDLLAAGWVGFVEAVIARWLATGRRDRETVEAVIVDSLDGLLPPDRRR
ncbi:TetR/AcrR family transcriptional regulator [Luteimicrobium sp. DT211]|uniref:TetR/AcrR family transcriptional regulator n=1 Tax=Luteimicrobium sp. DT211 TaxID=3393412 RepID=UPI003CEB4C66